MSFIFPVRECLGFSVLWMLFSFEFQVSGCEYLNFAVIQLGETEN